MTETTFAVCPSCGSPLLEQLLTDEDHYETEIGFSDGGLETPQLHRYEWLKGDCEERVIGCSACGAGFSLARAGCSATVDEDAAQEHLARLADGIDKDAFAVRAPSHIASCDCGNDVFVVELSRARLFGALYRAGDDETDPRWRNLIATPSFAMKIIYCPDCDDYLGLEDLVITQIAPVIHPDQMKLAF